jgi:hypothetical protein
VCLLAGDRRLRHVITAHRYHSLHLTVKSDAHWQAVSQSSGAYFYGSSSVLNVANSTFTAVQNLCPTSSS